MLVLWCVWIPAACCSGVCLSPLVCKITRPVIICLLPRRNCPKVCRRTSSTLESAQSGGWGGCFLFFRGSFVLLGRGDFFWIVFEQQLFKDYKLVEYGNWIQGDLELKNTFIISYHVIIIIIFIIIQRWAAGPKTASCSHFENGVKKHVNLNKYRMWYKTWA